MQLEQRIIRISEILEQYLPLIDQWDLNVIKGEAFEHPWLDKLQNLSKEDLAKFDAGREHQILQDAQWLALMKEIKTLTRFDSIPSIDHGLDAIGKQKKQHELNHLYTLLDEDKESSITDFGGGVGNLAYFLEKELQMEVQILEQDEKLIESGKKKLSKLGSKVQFHQCLIDKDNTDIPELSNSKMAIGLHTCGHFANNMFRSCINAQVSKIVNFGCCYSKIKDHDYNLSSLSNKKLIFNQRALSSATLGFGPIPYEFYEYRMRIMDYKYSFYHWLYKKHDHLEFCSMSNARRSLYKLSFPEFMNINFDKFFPDLPKPGKDELEMFYHSKENRNLNHYLSCYYAISRYIGQLLEVYLLCDRALFLKENNYSTEILEVFDSKISPRNKAIIAKSE